jgi:hypothetical protein
MIAVPRLDKKSKITSLLLVTPKVCSQGITLKRNSADTAPLIKLRFSGGDMVDRHCMFCAALLIKSYD